MVAFVPSIRQFVFGSGANLVFVNLDGVIQGSLLAVGIGTITAICYVSSTDRIFCISNSGVNVASVNPSSRAITLVAPSGYTNSASVISYSPTSDIIMVGNGGGNVSQLFNGTTLARTGAGPSGTARGSTWCETANEFACASGGSTISFVNPTTRAVTRTLGPVANANNLVYCGASLNYLLVCPAGNDTAKFYNASTLAFVADLVGNITFTDRGVHFDADTGLVVVAAGLSSNNAINLIDPQTFTVIRSISGSPSQLVKASASGFGTIMIAQNSTICRPFKINYLFTSGEFEQDLFTMNFSTSTITVLRSEPFFTFCVALDAFPFQGRSILFEMLSATDSNVNASMVLTGTADIPADGTLTFVGSRTLTLGTKSSYTLKAAIPAAGIVEVRNDVSLMGFTFASGATINKASGVGGTITVTVASTTGITAGTGVVIIEPRPTLTISGIPAGGIFTIWDDEVADAQDLGTALQTTDPTTGSNITYVGTAGNAVVYQFVPNTGDSANYQEFNVAGTIPATSTTLNLSSSLELETNI